MRKNVYTEHDLQKTIGELRIMFKASRFLRISASVEKHRSLSQNSIAAVWYEQIARELGEGTPEDAKCECKLRFGVPILRAEDEDFRVMYDGAIRRHMTYAQKLLVMRYLPVTSLMNVGQLSRYLQDVQKGYHGRVNLLFPDEWENAA